MTHRTPSTHARPASAGTARTTAVIVASHDAAQASEIADRRAQPEARLGAVRRRLDVDAAELGGRHQGAGGEGRSQQGDRLRRVRPSMMATAATTSDPGTTTRTTVSVRTLGTARAIAPTAHPVHAAAVPATCTARQ